MPNSPTDEWLDRLGRALREIRISVTDRCNFRCRYCMPREHFNAGFRYVPRDEILSFEEITRLAAILHPVGLRKIRITGGEPLLRHDLSRLVAMLKRSVHLEVAMTTNGVRLSESAGLLHSAGLDRLTVSLDALDEATFRRISDSPYSPNDVLTGLATAARVGFGSIKINCVVKRGLNDGQILPLVEHFRGTGHVLRFIEYMDTGQTNGWSLADVVTADEILATIGAKHPLEPLTQKDPARTSNDYAFKDGAGVIGVVASVSRPFCQGCTRARLTARGEIFTCLFARDGLDIRKMMRGGATDSELVQTLHRAWARRDDRYSETRFSLGAREHSPAPPLVSLQRLRNRLAPGRREMSYLGG